MDSGHGMEAHGGSMDRRLLASMALNGAITVAELVGGLLAGSLALLSDAAHNLSDVAVVALALWSRRLGRRPPTPRHTYGFRRGEVIAALVNAVALIAVSLFIGREALGRLLRPTPVAQGLMLAVGAAALAANVGSMLILQRHEREDVNVHSAFLHMVQDALASFVVVVAALLARTPFGLYVDPVAALVVVVAVLRSGIALVWETFSTLLEGAPADIDIETVARQVQEAFPLVTLHHVHVWQTGPGQRLLTAHVALAENLDGRAIETLFRDVKGLLREKWRVAHATLEPEVKGCGQSDVLETWGRS
jgi:cobalt-zinc-cadmium efflux system protein